MFLLRRLSAAPQQAKHGRTGNKSPTNNTKDDPTTATRPVTTIEEEQPVPVSSSSPPIRLLLCTEFAKFATNPGGVPFYEILPRDSYVEVSVEDFLSRYSKETAVVSWRWKHPKPPTAALAEEAMQMKANPVPSELVTFVIERTREEYPKKLKYLWLDWSCAPQYSSDALMCEINRSGMYYTHAASVLVWCFDSLDATRFAYSDYFNRAWTLSERLYRSKSALPLCASHVAPQCLTRAILGRGPQLNVDGDSPPWGVLLAKAMAKLQLSASMNQGGLIPEVVAEFVSETVCGRYPLVASALAAVENKNGSLVRVLTAPTLAALVVALRLFAVSEWIRNPDPADDMSQVLGFSPRDLKAFIIGVTVQQGRMTLNNFDSSSLTGILDDSIGIDHTLRDEITHTEGLRKLDSTVQRLWDEALGQQTTERANEQWLRRYLLCEIASYSAFQEQDKLFAVYKLFEGVQDRTSYDEVGLVWRDLCSKAGLEFITQQYGWLMELSLASLQDEDSAGGMRFFAENTRKQTQLSSADPRNFGVYSFPTATATAGDGTAPAMMMTMEQIFLNPEVTKQSQVVTYLCGFNFDERAAAKLGKKTNFTLVNKAQGGEIDSHLSLRGRKALGKLEQQLHELVTASFSILSKSSNTPFVTKANNGLFICARYHGLSNLCQVLVLRTQAYVSQRWTVECVGCFTSEAMKGSSWGVAKMLENLVKDFSALEHEHHKVQCVVVNKGTCAPFSEMCPLAVVVDDGKESFFKWPIDNGHTHERGATSYHDGLLIKKESVDVGDLVVFGKTTFEEKPEFNRIQKASQQIASLGATQDTLSTYYNLLQRNYVHDSIMASHLGYFGNLCEILISHLEKLGQVLLADASIRQSFDYLCEDMYDALDMAGENGERPEVIDKVRQALKRLSALITAVDGEGEE